MGLVKAVIDAAKAESLILESMPAWGAEVVPLSDAGGRVLRKPICADRDLPPYDRVMMDGLAMHHKGLAADTLAVEGTLLAGQAPVKLGDPRGGCWFVMTGAVLPSGCDVVIPCEVYDVDGSRVRLHGKAHEAGQFIHRRGSDAEAGAVLHAEGCLLGPPLVALCAAVGLERVQVSVRPKVGLLSTGDELVEVGQPLAAQQIRPSSTWGLAAGLMSMGCVVDRRHVRDDPAALRDVLEALLEANDLVLLSGGVSKGKADHVPSVLAGLGVEEVFHRVRLKPGKPLWFGVREAVPVFGLPGNPVSTLVCFRRFVVPAMWAAMGRGQNGKIAVSPRIVALAEPMVFTRPLTFFPPVRIEDGRAVPVRMSNSGDVVAVGVSDGFVELPAGRDTFEAGFEVPFFPW